MQDTITGLQDLSENGIKSMAALSVLYCVRVPRSYQEIEKLTGVDRTVVRKMIIRSPALFTKVAEGVPPNQRGPGKLPVTIEATPVGKKMIEALFK